jgi:hypothetical protein
MKEIENCLNLQYTPVGRMKDRMKEKTGKAVGRQKA